MLPEWMFIVILLFIGNTYTLELNDPITGRFSMAIPLRTALPYISNINLSDIGS